MHALGLVPLWFWLDSHLDLTLELLSDSQKADFILASGTTRQKEEQTRSLRISESNKIDATGLCVALD